MKNILVKTKEKYRKNKIAILVMLAIWLIAIFVTPIFYKDSLGNEPVGNEMFDYVVELDKNTTVKAIIPTEKDAKSVSIMFATYARKNKGKINIEVKGVDTNKIYAKKEINEAFMQDNASVTLGLDKKLDVNRDSKLEINISSNSQKGKSVAVYVSNEKTFDNSELYTNDELMDGDLSVKFLINNEDLNAMCNGIILYSSIALTVLLLIALLINPKYEVLFTIVTLVFGLIFIVSITPMSAPDEQLHYENCLQLSNYWMGNKEKHVFVEEEYTRDAYFGGHYNTCMAYIRLMDEFNEPLELSGELKECNTDVAWVGYTVYYFPQVLGITIGRLLDLNMLKLFYLGRFVNLLFYVICIYIAVKNTPIHKLLFGIIATLPIFMQQISSYSYDSFVLGLCFVEVAFLLKWMFNEEIIKIKDFIIVFLTCLGLAPAKIVYGFFSMLFVFVPVSRFGSKRNKIIAMLLLCAVPIYMILYNVYIRIEDPIKNIFAVYAESKNIVLKDLAPNGVKLWNTTYVVEHPIESIMIVLRTIRYCIKKWFYDAIGLTLSGQTLVIPTVFVYILIANIVLSSFRKEINTLPVLLRLAIIAVCIIIGLLTLVGMLTGWTPRGAELIEGVQGRYFCPVLPYFFTIFSNKKFGLSIKFDKYILFSQILVFYEILMYILSYTFVH